MKSIFPIDKGDSDVIIPAALLLDFGGVIAEAPPRQDRRDALVHAVHKTVKGAVSPDRIATDLAAASHAYAKWRDEAADRERPTEISQTYLWYDLVAGSWPAPAREEVRRSAAELSRIWAHRPGWRVRPGIRRALATATAARLAVAVVSNTLSGAAHRAFLDANGLSAAIREQIYSDEVGVRKPSPEPLTQAAARLGVRVGQCWFVGDSTHRDILCARRAGAGAAILMLSRRTRSEPPLEGMVPDATVDDGHGLTALLTEALGR